jgi:methylated-DNA-protein-cysteine methyltransferase-like protein
MQELLEKEGIEVVNDKIRNFDKHYWEPMKELEI